jgi:excisionase family DNA binding protein
LVGSEKTLSINNKGIFQMVWTYGHTKEQTLQKRIDELEQKEIYLSPKEFSEELGISRWTVYSWLSQGKLKSNKVGDRLVRIPKSELDRLLSEGNRPTLKEQLDAVNMGDVGSKDERDIAHLAGWYPPRERYEED